MATIDKIYTERQLKDAIKDAYGEDMEVFTTYSVNQCVWFRQNGNVVQIDHKCKTTFINGASESDELERIAVLILYRLKLLEQGIGTPQYIREWIEQ